MTTELKKLMERFELEIWLYLDGSLNKTDREFWDSKIKEYPELNRFCLETVKSLDAYDSIEKNTLYDNELEEMIKKAANKKGLIERLIKHIDEFFVTLFTPKFTIAKVAFVSILSVTALILLLTTENPNPVKEIRNGILDWQGSSITIQLNQVDNSLETLSKEEWEKYEYIQRTHDEWEQSFYQLNEEMEKLRQSLERSSL